MQTSVLNQAKPRSITSAGFPDGIQNLNFLGKSLAKELFSIYQPISSKFSLTGPDGGVIDTPQKMDVALKSLNVSPELQARMMTALKSLRSDTRLMDPTRPKNTVSLTNFLQVVEKSGIEAPRDIYARAPKSAHSKNNGPVAQMGVGPGASEYAASQSKTAKTAAGGSIASIREPQGGGVVLNGLSAAAYLLREIGVN